MWSLRQSQSTISTQHICSTSRHTLSPGQSCAIIIDDRQRATAVRVTSPPTADSHTIRGVNDTQGQRCIETIERRRGVLLAPEYERALCSTPRAPRGEGRARGALGM
ncbi:hypothetical protein AcW1_002699 [Taiwanofungus camphoratus]|nr:hypothetical protein AcW1_002699 [Antrodia cinnamomea]